MDRLAGLSFLMVATAGAACATRSALRPGSEAAPIVVRPCPAEVAACDGVTGPEAEPKRPWRRTPSALMSTLGKPEHRGRDALLVEGEPQWIVATFAYGPSEQALEGEAVDVFVERGCAGAWAKLGTVTTTRRGEHAPALGVEDTGGRVFFQVPPDEALPIGRHRVRIVVAGDRTHADLIVEVARPGAPIFVSDVDGTLTESEIAELPRFIVGTMPKAHDDASAALRTLAAKGYHAVYLTARPEWLMTRTRTFLAANGFPPGTVRTTAGATGNIGDGAARFKIGELAELRRRGLRIGWAFGNRPSDTEAYEAAAIEPRGHRVFFGIDDRHGGRRIDAYREILPEVAATDPVCE